MRQLAEMSAFVISLLAMAKTDASDAGVIAWQKLAARLLNSAAKVPDIGRNMLRHPDLRHSFFNAAYVEEAFYTSLLDEVRDSLFWSELVANMASNTLERATPPDELEKLSDEERQARVSALENAVWREVTRHGIDRLMFLLPEEAS